MDKSSSLGMPMSPQEIFKRYKRQSLGMPRSIPSSSTKVSGHLSMRYIFIASYTMCYSWSVFVFVCCFFSFLFVLFSLINSWILAFLCGRETHSIFQISWLVLETSTMFIVMQMKACFDCGIEFDLSWSMLFNMF
jgi:xanthine/uracil permease